MSATVPVLENGDQSNTAESEILTPEAMEFLRSLHQVSKPEELICLTTQSASTAIRCGEVPSVPQGHASHSPGGVDSGANSARSA